MGQVIFMHEKLKFHTCSIHMRWKNAISLKKLFIRQLFLLKADNANFKKMSHAATSLGLRFYSFHNFSARQRSQGHTFTLRGNANSSEFKGLWPLCNDTDKIFAVCTRLVWKKRLLLPLIYPTWSTHGLHGFVLDCVLTSTKLHRLYCNLCHEHSFAETCLENAPRGLRLGKWRKVVVFKLDRPFRWQPTCEMPVAKTKIC